jgi:uncharacterized membrane protein (UPF0127 family)
MPTNSDGCFSDSAGAVHALVNLTDELPVAGRVRVCSTRSERMRGLIGTPRLDPDQAVWILRCNSIHTFFMRMTIDVAFLDAALRVVKVVPSMTPYRVCLPVPGARSVVEGAVGMLSRARLRRGVQLGIRDSAAW